ncbi:MAG: hypothetical protein AAFW95_11115, partial [Cyanobacteria bacterium J06638_6]
MHTRPRSRLTSALLLRSTLLLRSKGLRFLLWLGIALIAVPAAPAVAQTLAQGTAADSDLSFFASL